MKTYSRELDVNYSAPQAFLHSMRPRFLGTPSEQTDDPMLRACMALFRSMPEDQQDRVLRDLGWEPVSKTVPR